MTNYEEIDAQFNAQYWAGRAAESRRIEAAIAEMRALKGQTVKVVKGRKVPVGTIGDVFWVGEGKYGWRVGFEDHEGTTHWTDVSNVEVWEEEPYEPPTCPVCDAYNCGGDGNGCRQYEWGTEAMQAEFEREEAMWA